MKVYNTNKFETALDFTEIFRKYENEHIAIREAMCLRAQYPAVLADIREGNLFAGRIEFGFVGFRYSYGEGDIGYFCNEEQIRSELEVEDYKGKAVAGNGDTVLYDAMLMCLGLFADVCLYYAGMAREKALTAGNASDTGNMERKQELAEMAGTLEKIAYHKPDTLREAIQLFWLYGLLTFVDNFGRMDVYLGDFYTKDIDSGRITEEGALSMLLSLYGLINDMHPGSGRIIIGGKGRPNEENADRFALLAMEAAREAGWGPAMISPQLSLRLYKGMNPAVFAKAIEVVGEGSTYPILYNDDINIPAVAKGYKVSLEEAEQYIMSNCGEYSLDHRSINSPNGSISYSKVFEITLFNGYDPVSGKPMGIKTVSTQLPVGKVKELM